MEANALSLSVIFGPTVQYRAPLFQRPYVWTEEDQWELLWNDLSELSNPTVELQQTLPYFMGAVVLEQLDSETGAPGARAIIDGQQRLTTVQVLMATLHDIFIKHYPDEFIVDDIKKLIINTSRQFADTYYQYKLWPTNLDREAYEIVMKATSPEDLTKHPIEGEGTIAEAYRYFYTKMNTWVEEKGEEGLPWLDRLFRIVTEKIRIVVIDMDKQDDAQTIFETMNARGTPLLPSDLVKNYLFKRLADENGHDLDEVYDRYWRPFDFQNGLWRKELKQGRLNRPALELFLQHYLVMEQAKEISATNLFKEYRAYSEAAEAGAHAQLARFHRYSQYFQSFLEAHDRNTFEGLFFHKLRTLDTTTVYPCLLWIYDSLEGQLERDQKLQAILQVIESFLIRRMVCQLTAKNYNNLFLELLTFLKKSQENCDASIIAQFFSSKDKDSGRWPNEEEFKEAWLTTPIYTQITRPRLRLILAELDKALKANKTEEHIVWHDTLTVEHLLPNSWEVHWPLNEEGMTTGEIFDAQQRRNLLKHSFGNLTFLNNSLNPAISNGPFEDKKREILKHTVLNLSRFLHEKNKWDEDSIIERGKDLFEIAKQIWPNDSKQLC
ncbi:DUF262 domain-containing protein [Pseudodesulfovibrio sp. zrk46]|uniref:DUF262 domain-containing protein n=1 Tax=Pseudodesulfovibrio sp. zrk46 TaxID=2725288 RepID=UPI0014496CFF|nr:DUF262 domain-containing protein [Pseudodesulfovibrio sp. zrk46]QJB55929.1 DUF262 domain-containing protein [Pseudodesulfovibrio sp. zrk46]